MFWKHKKMWNDLKEALDKIQSKAEFCTDEWLAYERVRSYMDQMEQK